MDIKTSKARSENMSAIRSKNTKPEILIRKFLFSNGFRFRVNDPKLPGCPDIVLKKYNTVIFMNGCFWHMHNDCKYFKIPRTNTAFWLKKLIRNKERDKNNYTLLTELNWNIIVIWECELKPDRRSATLTNLLNQLNNLI